MASQLSSRSTIMARLEGFQATARILRNHYREARLHGQVPAGRALVVAVGDLVCELLCEAIVGHEFARVDGSIRCRHCSASLAPGQHVGGTG